MKWIYLNNKITTESYAHISTKDRGFLLGDGIFETLLFSGALLFFDEHWERFYNSAQKIDITIPIEKENLRSIVNQLIKKNELSDRSCVVRWTLSRGIGAGGLSIDKKNSPSLLITVVPYLNQPSSTWRLQISVIRRNAYSPLSQIKSLNYLENILAYQAAQNAGFDDALMCGVDGKLLCTSKSNLFFVHHDQSISTAAVAEGVLPGIMRQAVIRILQKNKIIYREAAIDLTQLINVCEIFATNSLIGIQAISAIDGYWKNQSHSYVFSDFVRQFF